MDRLIRAGSRMRARAVVTRDGAAALDLGGPRLSKPELLSSLVSKVDRPRQAEILSVEYSRKPGNPLSSSGWQHLIDS